MIFVKISTFVTYMRARIVRGNKFVDMKKLALSTLILCSLSVSAQNDEDNWLGNQRPERVEEYVTDSNGTHKVIRKIGTPTGILKAKNPKIPVVLVQFPDRPFYASGKTAEEVRSNYDLFFNGFDNEKVRSATGSYGSVSSFFEDMSCGAFRPSFDLIGPITLSEGYAAYGRDNGSYKDASISTFYKEAVTMVAQEGNVDWSLYDNDENGSVDIVFFIYAGWGQNSSDDVDAIWPKEGAAGLKITDANGNNVSFSMYGLTCEARCIDRAKMLEDKNFPEYKYGYNPDNMKMDGVGVCLHEMSHALGLPDFYDTKNVAYGMDIWSIMDYGEYCNNGYDPVSYIAYERNFLGWEELPELTEPQVVTLVPFGSGGHGYKIVNPANPNEFYVIENRQRVGWDYMLSKRGHGMQVTHVDYNATRWNGNNVNTDPNHQYISIIPANNLKIGTNNAPSSSAWTECISGQLYPGTTLNYNLTDDTTPASTLFTANNGSYFMSKPLRNITENEDGTVTVCFCTNGKLDAPQAEATDVSENEFTASWASVENATKYQVEVEVENMGVVLDEVVESLSLKCSDLQPSTSLKFRVKALANNPEDYVPSDWSDYVYVQTDEDYIAELPESMKMVDVYAVNGTLVCHCKSSEIGRLDVCPGVYVVKYPNGAARKVVLR